METVRNPGGLVGRQAEPMATIGGPGGPAPAPALEVIMMLEWTRETLDNGLDVIVHEDHR